LKFLRMFWSSKSQKRLVFLIQTKNVDQSDRTTSQPTVGASMSAREGGIDCALIDTGRWAASTGPVWNQP
jgi:hypothetical protein